jgi:hypothetical protein
MKKTSILLSMLFMGFVSQAQTRLALYEEFTGENCPPCASTNPALDALLSSATNSVKINPIKWQVAIPSAPSATWSLYQTNSAEINNRDTYYNISSAPSGRCDGQSQTAFGASSDHPANWTSTHITNAANVVTPFAMTVTPTWDATFGTATVVVAIQSSATFTATNLRLRLVLVEKHIAFATAPGSNGEKDFNWPVRKSYPDIANGTALPNSWTAAQLQTYTIVCVAPSYIVSKGQMSFVGYLQDEGNKRIWQSGRTTPPPIPNEAQAMSANFASNVVCSSTVAPTATIKNNGVNAITDMTVTPYMNSVAGTPVVWTGNLAVGASTTIQMGVENCINGNNTYSFTITGVSGGDVVPANNGTSKVFFNNTVYAANPPVEGFVNASWPYTNWGVFNNNGAPHTWLRNAVAGGFMTSTQSIRLFINWTPNGGTHDLYLPGVNFTGTVAPALRFDLSYCQIATGDNDRLEVNISTNCGATWTTAWMNQGNAMATTPPNNSVLNTPSVSTQWSVVTVPLTTYSNAASVLIRFKATSDQGNSIWLDNINLLENPNTGITTTQNSVSRFDMYPNPATSEVNINLTSEIATNSTINITNTLGQIVSSTDVSVNSGSNTIKLDTKSLSSGIYFVTYGSGKETVTKKLTITK